MRCEPDVDSHASSDASSNDAPQCEYAMPRISACTWNGESIALTRSSQEFNLEKLQLVEQEKAKIRKDYERREGQVDVKKKMLVDTSRWIWIHD